MPRTLAVVRWVTCRHDSYSVRWCLLGGSRRLQLKAETAGLSHLHMSRRSRVGHPDIGEQRGTALIEEDVKRLNIAV